MTRAATLHCVYCGRPIRAGRTCRSHRDLEQLDPARQAERPAATDTEQGARSPYRAGDRDGRGELF